MWSICGDKENMSPVSNLGLRPTEFEAAKPPLGTELCAVRRKCVSLLLQTVSLLQMREHQQRPAVIAEENSLAVFVFEESVYSLGAESPVSTLSFPHIYDSHHRKRVMMHLSFLCLVAVIPSTIPTPLPSGPQISNTAATDVRPGHFIIRYHDHITDINIAKHEAVIQSKLGVGCTTTYNFNLFKACHLKTELAGLTEIDSLFPTDDHGHGTYCAGTAVGATVGVCRQGEVVAIKVLDSTGFGYNNWIIDSIQWAVNDALSNPNIAGKAVISTSIGGAYSPTLNAAVTAAVAAGIPVSVAAGDNDQDSSLFSPSLALNAMVVGATDIMDNKAG
ncbi:uncharacterized protein PAC_00250 [Phialocephala subalpina]|uniref:Peptidase S8/S53 domain-containing protein n=1 Tax=Phialocephala subalpina TaxID=576137 RepID=A0A1L7WC90_9HELO|nr:uncharacterized protein PAC_00250 [Phialocephala subalpina]